MKKLPIGIDDFEKLITEDHYFVDKSLLIKEILDKKAEATLIPRPRRFGKTINMSMLRYFFEISEQSRSHLFKNLNIAKHPDSMKHQGQYPIIFISFKEAKKTSWQSCYEKIIDIISKECVRHGYLQNSQALTEEQKKTFSSYKTLDATQGNYELALQNLCEYLALHHRKKPIVLIDEYDSPIHSGFINSYYDDVIEFMRSFLSAGLKGNLYLNFGIVTGILRIAKESIFSGLNNLRICSMLSDRHADKFGFLEPEVLQLFKDFNLEPELEKVRQWYNGYSIGDQVTMYNPWSILNFVDEEGKYKPYWINTSDNLLIKELVKRGSHSIKQNIEQLLSGEVLEKRIEENITFPELYKREEAIWNFLLFSGYLSFDKIYNTSENILSGSLRLPNNEVHAFYQQVILDLLESNLGISEYQTMLKSLVSGNIEEFKETFYDAVLASLSTFDTGGKKPERFYHALVVGMLVSLREHYEVTSNRESGYGRYDVMIIPRKPTSDNYGIIIEFKKKRSTDPTLEHAAQGGLKQIEDQAYEARLRDAGIQNIIKLSIAFDGKKVLILEG